MHDNQPWENDALRTLEATVDRGGLRTSSLLRQSRRTYGGADVAASSKRDPAEAFPFEKHR
jgi:hypothetical protein